MAEPRVMDFLLLGNMDRSDGGRETWAYNFLPRLLAEDPGLRIRLFGIRTEGRRDTTPDLMEAMGPAADRFEAVFFPVRRGRLPFFVSMLRALRRHTASPDFRPPTYSTASGVVEALMQRFNPALMRAKRVVWVRTIHMHEKANRIPRWVAPLIDRLEVMLLSSADVVIANGDDIADYYKVRGLQVRVIKNSVDARKWDIPPPALGQPLNIAYVGRANRVKGAEEFVAAARIIHASPDAGRFRFHLVGDAANAPSVAEAVAAGAIIHHGTMPNDALPQFLRSIDVCVAFTHASLEHGGGGTSNALMEQMAAGRVIVGWDNVIFRQMLDADNAWTVPQGDVQAVVEAFRFIADHPEEARRRAANAKASMQAYSFDAQMAAYADAVRAAGL